MAVTATFVPGTGVLTVTGDTLGNTIATGRNAAGTLLVNGGALPSRPTTPGQGRAGHRPRPTVH